MSLKNQVRSLLDGLSLPLSAPLEICARDGGAEFRATLEVVDVVGCAFTEFALSRDDLAGHSIVQLKGVAERLSQRLTYLLEPICPIEVDPDQCVVQMRSSPPQADDNGTRYYELLVRHGGELRLCRYAKQRGQPRQIVPAQVTQEVFLRLLGDFAEVPAA